MIAIYECSERALLRRVEGDQFADGVTPEMWAGRPLFVPAHCPGHGTHECMEVIDG